MIETGEAPLVNPRSGARLSASGRVFLRTGREGPLSGGNPWIFSQAIARVEPDRLGAGSIVGVYNSGGDLMGVGYYNPATTIAIRMLDWAAIPSLEAFIARRVADAIALRRAFIVGDTDSYRLINGEGDGLPGVVVDRYGSVLAMQLLTAGADAMRDELVAALASQAAPASIVERSTGAVRRQEGFSDRAGLAYGAEVLETVGVENGIRFIADLAHGQKTGAFLDQRDNRLIAHELASGARVLDACCYGGGFSLAALAGGARRVVAIDTAARALDQVRRNLELNGNRPDSVELVHQDAGEYMARIAQESHDRFDLIVLDPPPLARTRADSERAGRLYAELNAAAMRVLARGGIMLTFSCSVHLRAEDFVRAVRIAQTKSGRKLRMLKHLGPGADHPVLLGHAEGEYLTGLMLADVEGSSADRAGEAGQDVSAR